MLLKCKCLLPTHSLKRSGYREALSHATDGTNIELSYADTRIANKHILEKIRGQMEEADLCLFDLTGANANVALEFGISIGKDHPAVLAFPKAERSKLIAGLDGWDSLRYDDYADLGSQLVSKIKAGAVPVRKYRPAAFADVEEYLKRNQFGLEDDDRPQASIVVLPLPLDRHRLTEEFLDDVDHKQCHRAADQRNTIRT